MKGYALIYSEQPNENMHWQMKIGIHGIYKIRKEAVDAMYAVFEKEIDEDYKTSKDDFDPEWTEERCKDWLREWWLLEKSSGVLSWTRYGENVPVTYKVVSLNRFKEVT